MAKAKDFSKIGNSAVSKFLSNTDDTQNTPTTHNKHTDNTDNELMDGQIELSIATQDKETQQQTQTNSYTHNTHIEYNTQTTDATSKEIKSKRLNLLIQPSLLEDVKKVAYINKLSVNELIVRLIKDYTEQADQQAKIKKYDEL